MKLIATEKLLFESPDASNIYCFSPALCRLSSGRLIATFDLGGPGVESLPGVKSVHGDFGLCNQCKVFVSDDNGESWRHTADLPMLHARPFIVGDRLSIIGHNGALTVTTSLDAGETWSEVAVLESQREWHQAPCAVEYYHGKVYLTMEVVLPDTTWPGTAPVLMSIAKDADPRDNAAWRFSNELIFPQNLIADSGIGVPFFRTGNLTPDAQDKRFCGDPGWLESHVVRIHDKNHIFYDRQEKNFLVMMRAHTGSTNIAAVAKGVENPDGSLSLASIKTPAGAAMIYVPCPGGQMKFHLLYDEPSKLYWLVSTQATDSMIRPELLPDKRYNLPNNERNRLQLHFSKNLFDWCFAGMVAINKKDIESRNYPSMTVVDNDLLILSRSGDARAKSAHNGNLITLHRIKDFRKLVY